MEARAPRLLNRTMALDLRSTRVMPSMQLVRPQPQPSPVPAPSLPPMKSCTPSPNARLVMISDPDGAQAQGYRVLRDTLVAKPLPAAFAVSSAEAGDGKSTCAANLALALAEQHGTRVLLVDGNFAAPALARMLGVDHDVPAQAPPFTLSRVTPSLDVATIAPRRGQPSSFVDVAALPRLFHSFHRAGYRHIVVDAPSVESAPMLLQMVGGVLLVVRSGRSTSSALRRAVASMDARKALGVMLVGAARA